MADIVLNANAVGDVITYVAPGYLAYIGYRLRYPGADRPAGEVLIISVAISLLLVAVAHLLPIAHKPTDVSYVVILLAGSLMIGYLAAQARGRQRVKDFLGRLGYRMEPESSIFAQTLYHMSDVGTVLVEFKDGRRITGCPRNGPQYKDDGINELYIVYPEGLDDDGNPVSINGAGVIVPLTEVSNIVLSEDPTGAPEAPAQAEATTAAAAEAADSPGGALEAPPQAANPTSEPDGGRAIGTDT